MAGGEGECPGRGVESFSDLVTRQQQALLRLAFLLAGRGHHDEDLSELRTAPLMGCSGSTVNTQAPSSPGRSR